MAAATRLTPLLNMNMPSIRRLKRRDFLALSTGGASAFLLWRYFTGGQPRSQAFSDPTRTHASSARTYSSNAEGLLNVTLDARYEPISVAEQQATLYSYNGQIPGPRIETKPGDTVRIRFTNYLPNPTNIHYHGLHIPPTGNADNVFLDIHNGETFTYEFTIPEDHPAGLFYYHPHRHGFVAEQVFGGLGGMFVVRGELDQIPEVKAAKEEFLFLKDFSLEASSNGVQARPSRHMDRMWGRVGQLVTVNGQSNPSFSIPRGGLLRLRMLNASSARFYRLSLEEHPMHLIATDGISLSEPVEVSEVLLSPGERADVLIQGDRESGQYRLLDLPYSRGRMGMMERGRMRGGRMDWEGMGMMERGRMRGDRMDWEGMEMMEPSEGGTPRTLATISYSGQENRMSLPQQLIPIEALPEPQTVRRFVLNHGMNRGMGMAFLINGKTFDHRRIDTQVSLNTVEDWEITNTGMMDHPFHIHTNHFQVISRNGQPEPYRAWKDMVLVRPGETVRIRIRFADFSGKTVYHCHILDHEELGMMGLIEMTG